MTNHLERLQALLNKDRPVKSTDVLADLNDIIASSKIVAQHFAKEPKHRTDFITGIRNHYNQACSQADFSRDTKLKQMKPDVEALKKLDSESEAYAKQDRKLADKSKAIHQQYERDKFLALGSSLTLANNQVGEIEASLRSLEQREKEKEESRLRNMSTDELLREIIRMKK